MIFLTVEVEKVTYSNPEGFAITKCVLDTLQPDKASIPKWITPSGQLTVSGNFGRVMPGDLYDVEGDEQLSPKFGWQLKGTNVIVCTRRDARGLYSFLRKLPQIGHARAKAIIDHFKDVDLIFQLLETDPQRLTEIDGVTSERANQIAEEFNRLSGERDAWLFCREFNLAPRLTARIMEKLGTDARKTITDDPFQLMTLMNLTFSECDVIRDRLGIERDDPRRLAAGVLHLMRADAQAGHTWVLLSDLMAPTDYRIRSARSEINFTDEELQLGVDRLATESAPRVIFPEKGQLCLACLYHAEQHIADRLKSLLT